jgi:predicted nucleic acid-binding protein
LKSSRALFAFLNPEDSYHESAKHLFTRVKAGYSVQVSTLSLVELELLYKTKQMADQFLYHLALLSTLPNVSYVPLSIDVVLTAIALRQDYDISFFDSHYAATAIKSDLMVISTDQVYTRIPGIQLIEP